MAFLKYNTILILMFLTQLNIYCQGQVVVYVDADLGEPCSVPEDCANPDKTSCENNICVCNQDHVLFEGQDGTKVCLRKATLIGDDCTEDIQCTANLGEFSECPDITKKCGCIDNLGVPSKNDDTCLKIINQLEADECMESQQCQIGVPGALSDCLASENNPSTNVCRCTDEAINRPGFHVCLKKAQQIGDSCEQNIQCHAELTEWSYCLRGLCACIEAISVPNKNNDTCLEIINDLNNGTCDESQQCQHGIPGEFSDCVPSNDDPTKKVCMCTDEGLNEPGSSKCLRKATLVGDSCEAHIQCIANLGDLSFCLSRKCSCMAGVSVPSKGNDICLEIINNLEGDICQESQQCQSGMPGEFSDCLPLQNDNSKTVCQCSDKGVNKPGEHVCLEKAEHLGDTCEDNIQCTAKLGDLSSCISTTCECIQNSIPSEGLDKCLQGGRKLNETCEENKQCSADNSECVKGSSTHNVCKCKQDEFVESQKTPGICHQIVDKIGEPCEESVQCGAGKLRYAECLEDTCRCTKDYPYIGDTCVKPTQLRDPCTESIECIVYSNFTECSTNNICACVPSAVEKSGKCYQRKVTGDGCSTEMECKMGMDGDPALVTCSSNQCACVPEYVAKPQGNICYAVANKVDDECVISVQCVAKLGPRSLCNFGKCTCFPGTFPNIKKTTCLGKVFLNDSCEMDEQCPTHGTCISLTTNKESEKFCRCGLTGFVESAVNMGQCLTVKNLTERTCNEDIQCTSGINENAYCGEHLCKCKSSAVELNETCWKKKVIGDSCDKSDQCAATIGGTVTCLLTNGVGTCKCGEGAIMGENGTTCVTNGATSVTWANLSEIKVLFITFIVLSTGRRLL